jgi:hypothetical protein
MSRRDELEDFVRRHTLADVYPRKEDPFRPAPGILPGSAPGASYFSPEELGTGTDPFSALLTQPGQRPIVYQQAINFGMTATAVPTPLQAQQFQCDSFVIDPFAAAALNVWVGFGSGVTVTSGIEVVAGAPVEFAAQNTREQWEIQRLLEVIAAMIANERGYSILGQYRAPRVVLDASQWYVVAPVATPISVTIFPVPLQQ